MRSFKLLIILVLISFQSCTTQSQKINGVSFVASTSPINETHVTPVVDVHANYAAVMPFGFIKDIKAPLIRYNTSRQWFGETKAGVKQYIEVLQRQQLKVMLKPQIWVWHGTFTGYIKMENEADWKALEASYSTFILDYAQVAQDTNVNLFCIGTELEQFVKHRPAFWLSIIKKIRQIYKGKLTYAANWDEFKRTPFWKALDFVGIDAYFPVSISKTPTVAECLEGWKAHKHVVKNIAEMHGKPVLFTEFGYRSVDYTAKAPWKSDRNMTQVNLEGQTNATKALFEAFWNEDWFAGGFIWKWFHNHKTAGGITNSRFTPQNKPVEQLLKAHYKLQ